VIFLNINEKKYPKEYYILEMKLLLNKELFEQSIISFEIFNEMQKFLIRKMDLIINNSKADIYEHFKS